MDPPSLDQVDSVLLDIEGTICPISWVKETLFPYALKVLPEILDNKWDDQSFAQYKAAFPSDARATPQALQQHVLELTTKDIKVAYLKNLQGYLWEAGFESRAYSAPLFDDVLPALDRWREQGISCNVYSSGSVFAQKLLFGHIKDPASSDPKEILDRRDFIRDWFDTVNAGPKLSENSYKTIARCLGKDLQNILFLSDNVKEIEAALSAGMQAIIVDRPGNAPLSGQDRQMAPVVTSFDNLLP